MRRLNVGMSHEPVVIPRLVIRDNQHDVGRTVFGGDGDRAGERGDHEDRARAEYSSAHQDYCFRNDNEVKQWWFGGAVNYSG